MFEQEVRDSNFRRKKKGQQILFGNKFLIETLYYIKNKIEKFKKKKIGRKNQFLH